MIAIRVIKSYGDPGSRFVMVALAPARLAFHPGGPLQQRRVARVDRGWLRAAQ
jgi:hypothetical protein